MANVPAHPGDAFPIMRPRSLCRIHGCPAGRVDLPGNMLNPAPCHRVGILPFRVWKVQRGRAGDVSGFSLRFFLRLLAEMVDIGGSMEPERDRAVPTAMTFRRRPVAPPGKKETLFCPHRNIVANEV